MEFAASALRASRPTPAARHDRATTNRTVTAPGEVPGQPPDFRALLRELVDEDTYPRLYRIAWSARPEHDLSGNREHEEFLLGVERILDGVQVLIERA